MQFSKYYRIYFISVFFGCITSCSNNPIYDDDGCPFPDKYNAIDIAQIFYNPYENKNYATSSDTVDLGKFAYNFEVDFEPIAENGQGIVNSYIPGCNVLYDAQNISNIQIFLTTSFGEIPPGSDISYLFAFQDGTQLNRYRDFSKMNQFNSLTFNQSFIGYRRLNTRMIIFLRNGYQLLKNSSSPILFN